MEFPFFSVWYASFICSRAVTDVIVSLKTSHPSSTEPIFRHCVVFGMASNLNTPVDWYKLATPVKFSGVNRFDSLA